MHVNRKMVSVETTPGRGLSGDEKNKVKKKNRSKGHDYLAENTI
jgi:hypothetical protein